MSTYSLQLKISVKVIRLLIKTKNHAQSQRLEITTGRLNKKQTVQWLQLTTNNNRFNKSLAGNTVFCGKFFQIPQVSLPNSAAHRGKFSTHRK